MRILHVPLFTCQSTSKAPPEDRPQPTTEAATAPTPPDDPGGSTTLPKRATDAIDAQRRNLQIADSMLGCLVIALEYASWVPRNQRPDYSDAARGVRRILVAAIDRLDSVNLERTIATTPQASP